MAVLASGQLRHIGGCREPLASPGFGVRWSRLGVGGRGSGYAYAVGFLGCGGDGRDGGRRGVAGVGPARRRRHPSQCREPNDAVPPEQAERTDHRSRRPLTQRAGGGFQRRDRRGGMQRGTPVRSRRAWGLRASTSRSTPGRSWTQPTYTGWSARGCLGSRPCTPTVGPIGTLPWYFEHGLVSDGDPAVAFGPRPGPGGFSWSNGSRLYYANLTSNFGGTRTTRRSTVSRRSPSRAPTTCRRPRPETRRPGCLR